ncbi:MAG: hypothetical protein M1833_006664 [Piccolia ochrophora]|nr:MAG: hypothetical protein M1833_006664 [Piccolia ochrophora]
MSSSILTLVSTLLLFAPRPIVGAPTTQLDQFQSHFLDWNSDGFSSAYSTRTNSITLTLDPSSLLGPQNSPGKDAMLFSVAGSSLVPSKKKGQCRGRPNGNSVDDYTFSCQLLLPAERQVRTNSGGTTTVAADISLDVVGNAAEGSPLKVTGKCVARKGTPNPCNNFYVQQRPASAVPATGPVTSSVKGEAGAEAEAAGSVDEQVVPIDEQQSGSQDMSVSQTIPENAALWSTSESGSESQFEPETQEMSTGQVLPEVQVTPEESETGEDNSQTPPLDTQPVDSNPQYPPRYTQGSEASSQYPPGYTQGSGASSEYPPESSQGVGASSQYPPEYSQGAGASSQYPPEYSQGAGASSQYPPGYSQGAGGSSEDVSEESVYPQYDPLSSDSFGSTASKS